MECALPAVWGSPRVCFPVLPCALLNQIRPVVKSLGLSHRLTLLHILVGAVHTGRVALFISAHVSDRNTSVLVSKLMQTVGKPRVFLTHQA